MLCPGCHTAMRRLTLGGRLGVDVVVDACTECRAFWFDPFETIRLSEESTDKLVAAIQKQRGEARPLPDVLHCPICDARLVHAHDRQRNTPFEYRRCPNDHGRFTSFADFLREKDFVRPITQNVPLPGHVQSVNCGNCGAPVDLTHTSTCGYCGTAVAVVV